MTVITLQGSEVNWIILCHVVKHLLTMLCAKFDEH